MEPVEVIELVVEPGEVDKSDDEYGIEDDNIEYVIVEPELAPEEVKEEAVVVDKIESDNVVDAVVVVIVE